MATAVGIIFSNIHDKNISELTRMRTMASVPFGCRYRLVDFALSNMVNSGITNVGVITHYNYQSLMDHIGSGKDWDLARNVGGIKILPPYITAYANSANSLYTSRLEALQSIIEFISDCKEDYVVLTDCDIVANIDFKEIIKHHIDTDADLTVAVKEVYIAKRPSDNKRLMGASKTHLVIKSDSENRIVEAAEYSQDNISGRQFINTNIYVIGRKFLEDLLLDAIAHGYKSFTKDIIIKNIGKCDLRTYTIDKYFTSIGSLGEYYTCNMDLLLPQVRADLFGVKERPVYTKIRNSAPTIYCDSAKVENSLIADGCIIDGEVKNSILFRGVKVAKGAKVENSILMQDTYVGESASLSYVISDKNVNIRDGRVLAGAPTLPYYIGKQTNI